MVYRSLSLLALIRHRRVPHIPYSDCLSALYQGQVDSGRSGCRAKKTKYHFLPSKLFEVHTPWLYVMPPHISTGSDGPSVQFKKRLGRLSLRRRNFLRMQGFLVLRVSMLLTMREASVEAEISPVSDRRTSMWLGHPFSCSPLIHVLGIYLFVSSAGPTDSQGQTQPLVQETVQAILLACSQSPSNCLCYHLPWLGVCWG